MSEYVPEEGSLSAALLAEVANGQARDLRAARLRIRVLEASLAAAEDWPGGLDNGCGNGVHYLADHLAQAWLVISRAEEGDGRSNRSFPDEIPAYVDEDWSKMVARRIEGYARLHSRPIHFPWKAREFDRFSWRDAAPTPKDDR